RVHTTKYSPVCPCGRCANFSFSYASRCTTSGHGMSAWLCGMIDIDNASTKNVIVHSFLDFARNDSLQNRGCLIISRQRIVSSAHPIGSRSVIFLFRIRTAVASTRTGRDTVCE